MYKISQTDKASIELFSDNIFNISVSAGAEIDLEDAKRLMRAINSVLLSDGDVRAGVIDLSKITSINEDARNYLLSGACFQNNLAAIALTSTSLLGKSISDLALTFQNQITFPILYFDSPIRANHWVRAQLQSAAAYSKSHQHVA